MFYFVIYLWVLGIILNFALLGEVKISANLKLIFSVLWPILMPLALLVGLHILANEGAKQTK